MGAEIFGKIAEKVAKATEKMVEATKEKVGELDKKLSSEIKTNGEISEKGKKINTLDKPLNTKTENLTGNKSETKEVKKLERMQPPIEIKFKCPEGMDKKEFSRQLKAQERGLNSQTIAQNMDNRAAFEQRKADTGNGRDVSEGKKAQEIAREKALHSRIETNQKKGMSYSEAKKEAEGWIKTQAALHNPDQIAGGDPTKVSRMGDANVNSSIGSQWRTRVGQLSEELEDYAKDKSREQLENTKMNVKLVVE